MANEEKNITPNVFDGFEAFSKNLVAGDESNSDLEGSTAKEIDPSELMKEVEKEVKEEANKTDDTKKDDAEGVEDTVKKEDTIKDDDTVKDDVKKDTTDDGDLSEYESDIASFLQGKLSEELDIKFPDEDKFESIKDVVDYISDAVAEASIPEYASDDVKKLDEYVRNGGTIADFAQAVKEDKNVDNYNIENETDQKEVIKELLGIKGYDDAQIKRALTRYEDAGVLAEEAEDSLDLLKKYKVKEKERLLENAKKQSEHVKQEQQKFFSNVESTINNIDSIRGIKISSREKQDLLDYIFKPDENGITKYQKDYSSDIKNLLESAYFTKKGDVLIDTIKKDASSKAYKELHQKLKANKDKRTFGSRNQRQGENSDTIGLLSKVLLN